MTASSGGGSRWREGPGIAPSRPLAAPWVRYPPPHPKPPKVSVAVAPLYHAVLSIH
jgi:hypothetical protein